MCELSAYSCTTIPFPYFASQLVVAVTVTEKRNHGSHALPKTQAAEEVESRDHEHELEKVRGGTGVSIISKKIVFY